MYFSQAINTSLKAIKETDKTFHHTINDFSIIKLNHSLKILKIISLKDSLRIQKLNQLWIQIMNIIRHAGIGILLW
jgi:hypothetical protein